MSVFLRKKSRKVSVALHLFCCSTTCDLHFMVQDGGIHIPGSRMGKAKIKGKGRGHILSLKEGSGKDYMIRYLPFTRI